MCSDKTPAQNDRSSRKASMQEHVGKTAETFEALLAYILIACPVLIVLKNVKEMLCVYLDVSAMSDAMWLLKIESY